MRTVFYSQIISAKDGNLIPLCKNNSTGQESSLHSKYNPLREAEGFASSIAPGCSFFVILGLCGGYHIKKLIEKFPESKVLAVENSIDDIEFLSEIPCVQALLRDKRIKVSGIENLSETLLQFYKPHIHGNLTILSLRQWENSFPESYLLAKEKINESVKLLASDFSVQSHFGKIWQKNILSNLKILDKIHTPVFQDNKKDKVAAVIAAGPGLDDSIKELKTHREKYFIIATDTAFSSLLKQQIISDAVVSIDGQSVSHEHYIERLPSGTIYAFDLCANSSSVRKALKAGAKVLFFETGHPLAQYASFFDGNQNLPHLEAGSGTVTIAGASLAKSLGFEKIEFFGADFSYTGGRPYCRGTYLESKYYSNSTRLSSAEKSYTALMYRTPVIKLSENRITTEILQAYKDSLEVFMKNLSQKENQDNFLLTSEKRFSYDSFISQYCRELKETFKNPGSPDETTNAFTTILPLLAKLGRNFSFVAYLKKLEYNI